MTADEIRELLAENNPEALMADGFEAALIGTCQQFSRGTLALYDRAKCIQILVDRDGMTEEEAEEFFEFNVQGAWMGDGTPVFAELIGDHRDDRS